MKVEKIADGAYYFPAYSEQTIAWSPSGCTIEYTDRQKLELDITQEFEFADGEATRLIDEALGG